MESDGIEDALDLGIDLVQDPEELAGLRKIDFGDTDTFHRFQCLLGVRSISWISSSRFNRLRRSSARWQIKTWALMRDGLK